MMRRCLFRPTASRTLWPIPPLPRGLSGKDRPSLTAYHQSLIVIQRQWQDNLSLCGEKLSLRDQTITDLKERHAQTIAERERTIAELSHQLGIYTVREVVQRVINELFEEVVQPFKLCKQGETAPTNTKKREERLMQRASDILRDHAELKVPILSRAQIAVLNSYKNHNVSVVERVNSLHHTLQLSSMNSIKWESFADEIRDTLKKIVDCFRNVSGVESVWVSYEGSKFKVTPKSDDTDGLKKAVKAEKSNALKDVDADTLIVKAHDSDTEMDPDTALVANTAKTAYRVEVRKPH